MIVIIIVICVILFSDISVRDVQHENKCATLAVSGDDAQTRSSEINRREEPSI